MSYGFIFETFITYCSLKNTSIDLMQIKFCYCKLFVG